jgi:hypothetical protein
MQAQDGGPFSGNGKINLLARMYPRPAHANERRIFVASAGPVDPVALPA